MHITFKQIGDATRKSIEEWCGREFMYTYQRISFVKEWLRRVIKEWCEENGIEAHIRIMARATHNISRRDGKRISDGFPPEVGVRLVEVTIHNGKGSLNEKYKWMNKINVNGDGVIISQVARTDPDYLLDTAEEFAEFIQSIQEHLLVELDLTKLESAVQ